MHSAPAVNYPVGRSRFQGQLIGVLVALGCLTGVWWWSGVSMSGWRQALFFVTLLLAALVAARAWWRSPTGVLVWDGEAWCFNGVPGAISGKLQLHLDMQFFMLLCLEKDTARGAGRLWLWLDRRAAPTLWLALRRAVVSSATQGASRASAEASALLKP
jgi:hypothetical protein